MLTLKKQYVGSNTSSSEEGYTSTNPIKFYMGFMQETLDHFFFLNKQNALYNDVKVQIIDYTDRNNPERSKDFWIYHLNTIFQQGFNARKLNYNLVLQL